MHRFPTSTIAMVTTLTLFVSGCSKAEEPAPKEQRPGTFVPTVEPAPGTTLPEGMSTPPASEAGTEVPLTIDELLPEAHARQLLPGEIRPADEERRHIGDKVLRKVMEGQVDVEQLGDSDREIFEEAMARMRERERAHRERSEEKAADDR